VPTGRVYISRHVVFDEGCFPFAAAASSPAGAPSTDQSVRLPLPDADILGTHPSPPGHPSTPVAPPPDGGLSESSPARSPSPAHTGSATASSGPSPTVDRVSPSSSAEGSPMAPPPRTRALSYIYAATTPAPQHSVSSRHPLPVALLSEVPPEPTCFSQASKDPAWRLAMASEFDALLRNGTWSLVPRHPHMNVVGFKWVFKVKQRADGSIDRHKAHLVAKGFRQQPGVDYFDTFSPVIKITTVCLLLAIVVSSQWPIRQLDVSNAFLHGQLQE